MEAVALRVVPRKARPLVTFTYRGAAVAVELTEDGAATLACPVCGARCQIPETHELVVNFRVKKAMTIFPSISCPSPRCGFRIVVVRGFAVEVERNHAPEEPERALASGEKRCEECGRAFRPGGLPRGSGRYNRVEEGEGGRRICQRCTPNGRGKWSTKKKR